MTVRNLRAEIARKDLSKGEIARALGISQSALSDRLSEPSRFRITECHKIRDKFFPEHTIDYLFEISE
jgi:predicted transcriptional regulator